jgi:DNA polymerase delta subunit 3
MATDFRKHLAIELVSEHKTVSYRTLARAVKVHVNAAKCMLYDFYEEQSKRKPGSVYATYLISGTKKLTQPSNGRAKTNGAAVDEDEPMPSSPPIPSSSMPVPSQQQSSTSEREEVKIRTVTLVREENLEGTRRAVIHLTRTDKDLQK